MRIEQVIAAVARPVAVATVREILAVVAFVRGTGLHHLWLQRMPLGMPAYACVPSCDSTRCGNPGGSMRDWRGHGVNKRPGRPSGDMAFRSAGWSQG